jgi:hypothetical protein
LEGLANKSLRSLAVLTGLLACTRVACPADLSLPVPGNLLGVVINADGVPQMGASVQLFDRVGRLRARTSSLADGRFAFAALPADLYSVRVTVAAYLPAISDRISIRPGLDSILEIHLATLLSSVQFKYSVPSAAMSNDWKWVLRSSPATRPITRFRPQEVSISGSTETPTRIFSETHAAVAVSGGDSSFVDTDAIASAGGAGFALSTNVLGRNQLRLAGTVGQTTALYPGAMGFSALYTRQDTGSPATSPEIAVSMTQLGLVNGVSGPNLTQPGVRIVSVSVYQAMDLTSDTRIEYGVAGEILDSFSHTTRSSPFLRVTRSFGETGDLVASFSDGSRPDALLSHQEDASENSPVEMTRLPQVSYRDGRLQMERSFSYEIGYRKVSGKRTVGVSAFNEHISDGRLNVAGDRDLLGPSNLMSDGVSATSIYNVGSFSRSGAVLSEEERISQFLSTSIAYGWMGGFSAATGTFDSNGILNGFLNKRDFHTGSANATFRIPKAGTRISTGYGLVCGRAIIPQHVFTTQNAGLAPGLNVSFHQPLPTLFGMPGHLELSAELRNLLAQGYLPIDAGGSKNVLMVQAPRAVRGGVNFTF